MDTGNKNWAISQSWQTSSSLVSEAWNWEEFVHGNDTIFKIRFCGLALYTWQPSYMWHFFSKPGKDGGKQSLFNQSTLHIFWCTDEHLNHFENCVPMWHTGICIKTEICAQQNCSCAFLGTLNTNLKAYFSECFLVQTRVCSECSKLQIWPKTTHSYIKPRNWHRFTTFSYTFCNP